MKKERVYKTANPVVSNGRYVEENFTVMAHVEVDRYGCPSCGLWIVTSGRCPHCGELVRVPSH